MPLSLTTGIYAPTQVFFSQTSEDLDLETIGRHAVRLVQAGIAGITVNGSNGEAIYLSPAERATVVRTTRSALDAACFEHIPIMVGASEQSVRGTLALIEDAALAGGDAALLMVPSFFRWAMDSAAIERYYTEVADKSCLPIIIYNYPAAVSGIDLDSDMLTRLADHTNIVGTKFTCGNIGKLARVAAVVKPKAGHNTLAQQECNSGQKSYFAFAGVADFITPTVIMGGSGAIVGAANVFPRACVNVYNLTVSGRHEEARQAQLDLARADWGLTKRAIPGFKAILQHYHGYGGKPRSPMAALESGQAKELCDEIRWMMEFEQSLADAAYKS